MTADDVLSGLLCRLEAATDGTLIIGRNEVAGWEEGILKACLDAGLLTQATPAKSIECDGCEEACMRPVLSFPGSPPRAFVVCDRREDTARVPVPLHRLHQWKISYEQLVRVLLPFLGHQFQENQVRDVIRTLPLRQLLSMRNDRLRIDTHALTHALNPTVAGAMADNRNRLVLAGDHWSVAFNGTTRTFKDTYGTRYIAHLIRNRGKEISVSDLYYAVHPPLRGAIGDVHSSITAEQLEEFGLSVSEMGDAGEPLSPEVKEMFRQRRERLSEQIEEAREFGDEDALAKLQAELEQMASYLTATYGLGGRPRKTSSTIERLRKNVRKCIRKDIAKIKSVFPALGHHLDCIKTGTFCQYAPHPEVEWHFEPL